MSAEAKLTVVELNKTHHYHYSNPSAITQKLQNEYK